MTVFPANVRNFEEYFSHGFGATTLQRRKDFPIDNKKNLCLLFTLLHVDMSFLRRKSFFAEGGDFFDCFAAIMRRKVEK